MVPIFELAGRQFGAFTFHQAVECGMPRHRLRIHLRDGAVVHVAPGLFVVAGAAQTWEQQVMLAILRAGPGTVAGYRSAAAIWALPGFPPRSVEVLRARGRNTRHTLGRLRETVFLPPEDCTTHNGLPVTTVTRTLLSLAAIVHPERLHRLVDAALARKLVDLEVLRHRFDQMAGKGVAGTVAMRAVLAKRSPGHVAPESELEAELFDLLERAGLPLPTRQRSVGGTSAGVGRVDFVFHQARLVVEADGRVHHTALSDWESDRERDLRLLAAGWRVIRVTWHQVTKEPDLVVAAIAAALSLPVATTALYTP